jgi:thioredoxin-related protein
MLTREVYTDQNFIEFSRSQVFVRVFEDTQPEGARLAGKYDVSGFPTLIILDSGGQEVDRIEGAMRAKDLMKELQLIFKSAKSERISI